MAIESFTLTPHDGYRAGTPVHVALTKRAAVARLVRMAARLGQSVDLFRPYEIDDNRAYVGTASPSTVHEAGARFSADDLRG